MPTSTWEEKAALLESSGDEEENGVRRRGSRPGTNTAAAQREQEYYGADVELFDCCSGDAVTSVCDAFSFGENLKALFYSPESHLAPLNGLRAVAFVWVLLFHIYYGTLVFVLSDPSFNAEKLNDTVHFLSGSIERLGLHGHLGFDIGFVVAGFLAPYTLLQHFYRSGQTSMHSQKYWVRRFMRMWPSMMFVMGMTLVFNQIVFGNMFNQLLNGDPCEHSLLWRTALFVQNYNPDGSGGCPSHTWAMAIEFQFFIVAPIFVFIHLTRPKWQAKALVALGIVGSVATQYLEVTSRNVPKLLATPGHLFEASSVQEGHSYQYTWCRLHAFLFGMFVALVQDDYHRSREQYMGGLTGDHSTHTERTQSRISDVTSLLETATWRTRLLDTFSPSGIAARTVMLGIIIFVPFWGTGFYSLPPLGILHRSELIMTGTVVLMRPLFAGAIAYLMWWCLNGGGGLFRWFLSHPWLYPIAAASYSCYLVQFIPLSILTLFWPLNPSRLVLLAGFGIYVLLIIPFGLVVYLLIEKPFIRMRPSA